MSHFSFVVKTGSDCEKWLSGHPIFNILVFLASSVLDAAMMSNTKDTHKHTHSQEPSIMTPVKDETKLHCNIRCQKVICWTAYTQFHHQIPKEHLSQTTKNKNLNNSTSSGITYTSWVWVEKRLNGGHFLGACNHGKVTRLCFPP